MSKKNSIASHGVADVKAEDELVAIILSAIVGRIIESWELIPTVPFQDQSKSNGEVIVTNVKIDGSRPSDSVDSKLSKNYIKRRSANSNQLLTETHDHFEKIKRTSKNVQNGYFQSEEHDSSRLSIRVEENFQQVLRSLFQNEKENILGWTFLETNQQVSIVFKQGNKYEGSLSKCRMHGPGKFSWTDGSMYKGTFLNGEMTGEGYLEWPDQSWYEGEFLQGFRNSIGLFVMDPVFYVGTWECGLREGQGTMYYKLRDTNTNYYNGEWLQDKKHGTALRSYASGAMYSGEWQHGLRHGLGTMVWTNNDVFSGYWDHGQIHGYGEYTWETFFNQQLVVPQENCYYGEWCRGVRHGKGTLETSLGVTIYGTWDNGKKCGQAKVICSNGNLIYAENLFCEDNVSFTHEGLYETDSLMDATTDSCTLFKVPVNSPSQEIDLNFYVQRLNHHILNCSRKGKTYFNETKSVSNILSKCKHSPDMTVYDYKLKSPGNDKNYELGSRKIETTSEESSLRNIILQYLSTLRMLYTRYSELCCEVKPTFSTVMMRLMFWQMLRDCNLHDRKCSLANLDILIANNKVALFQSIHYPFERIQFWQYLHCLLEISWELYGKNCSGSPTVPGVLASAFHKLITSDILPNVGQHKGDALFKYKNLLSLESVYSLYKSIGEPHSARQLLKEFMVSRNENDEEPVPHSFTCGFPKNINHGQNIVGVGGKLTYYPKIETVLPSIHGKATYEHPLNLTHLNRVGLAAVFDCIKTICPGINCKNIVVNMDYKIIFLEFLEILLLCAKLQIKLNNTKEESTGKNDIYEQINTTADEPLKENAIDKNGSKTGKSKIISSQSKKNKKKK